MHYIIYSQKFGDCQLKVYLKLLNYFQEFKLIIIIEAEALLWSVDEESVSTLIAKLKTIYNAPILKPDSRTLITYSHRNIPNLW